MALQSADIRTAWPNSRAAVSGASGKSTGVEREASCHSHWSPEAGRVSAGPVLSAGVWPGSGVKKAIV